VSRAEACDVLVVGAGPAGCCTAERAAAAGARVLLVEKRRQIGLPVQCAEFVPWQLGEHVPIPRRCIAQDIDGMRTFLPDGRAVLKTSRGYVLERSLLDKHLAVLAHLAGAELWVGWKAAERDGDDVLLRRGQSEARVRARVIVGADGPRSTVARWLGLAQGDFVHGAEVELVLRQPRPAGEIYFHPAYAGGYGWLFPKGETANVGVAVSTRMGARPGEALAHLLDHLGLSSASAVGRLGGLVPTGGPVAQLRVGNVLLVGDAGGLAHPVTGGGIAPAVLSGQMAGEAAARAVLRGDLSALDAYPAGWHQAMGGPMRQALANRRYLDARWSCDPAALSAVVAETWIAFPAYGRPKS
jgi:digeranylgeranylglycerophospholipid reductase